MWRSALATGTIVMLKQSAPTTSARSLAFATVTRVMVGRAKLLGSAILTSADKAMIGADRLARLVAL